MAVDAMPLLVSETSTQATMQHSLELPLPRRSATPRPSGSSLDNPRLGAAGFTLLELLVVVAIIGILAMIAMRQFTEYRLRSYDARATADLRNAATAEEAYFVATKTYITGNDIGPGASSFLPGLMVSDTVSLAMTANGSEGFSGTATSSQGTKAFSYDSQLGGMQSQ